MNDKYIKTLLIWLEGAAQLPGKSPVQMAIAIQSLSRVLGRSDQLPIEPSMLQEFEMSRTTAMRALGKLVEAELIELKVVRGEVPHVMILGMDPAWWWERRRD